MIYLSTASETSISAKDNGNKSTSNILCGALTSNSIVMISSSPVTLKSSITPVTFLFL